MKKAVLFLTFNRLDVVQKAFDAIRRAKPPRFYVASDGARKGVEGEKEKVEQVRKWILDNIDWDCEVKTRFLKENSGGCANGVSGAVTWFFENEEDGIILEDDCVANQSFFAFCEELLDKYKDDKRVWHISGDGFYDDKNAKESYYFAKIMHCWGWASWADRWQHFKLDLKDYDEKYLKNFSKRKDVQKYWLNILTGLQNGEIDSWAYPWTFLVVANKGIYVTPDENLILNIGTDGVHSLSDDSLLNASTDELDSLKNQDGVIANKELPIKIYQKAYPYTLIQYFSELKLLEKIFSIKNAYDFNGEKIGKVVTLMGLSLLIPNFLANIEGKINYFFANQIYKTAIKRIRKGKSYHKYLKKIDEILKYSDPIVKMNIDGKKDLYMNLSHKLPIYYAQNFYYDRALPRICKQLKDIDNRLAVIDVGANIADGVNLINNKVQGGQFLCIEGDEKFLECFELNTKTFPKNTVFLEKSFCSDDDKIQSASVIANNGTARIVDDEEEGASSIKFKTLDKIISEYPYFSKANILKIDTDGFEMQVLKGAKNLISKIKPLIFFEYTPALYEEQNISPLSVIKFLYDNGYKKALFYDNFGFALGIYELNDLGKIKELISKIDNKNIYYYDILACSDENFCKYNQILEKELVFRKV